MRTCPLGLHVCNFDVLVFVLVFNAVVIMLFISFFVENNLLWFNLSFL